MAETQILQIVLGRTKQTARKTKTSILNSPANENAANIDAEMHDSFHTQFLWGRCTLQKDYIWKNSI